MARMKIRAKMKSTVKPSSESTKKAPVKPVMAADSGLLTEKIITVVRQKKASEKSKNEGKDEKV